MPGFRPTRAILLACIFILLVGCDEEWVSLLEGEYALVEVDGQPLPLPAPGYDEGTDLIEAELTMALDGTFVIHLVLDSGVTFPVRSSGWIRGTYEMVSQSNCMGGTGQCLRFDRNEGPDLFGDYYGISETEDAAHCTSEKCDTKFIALRGAIGELALFRQFSRFND